MGKRINLADLADVDFYDPDEEAAPTARAGGGEDLAPKAAAQREPIITTRSRRRRPGPLSATEMVSFNCRMIAGLRRVTRAYAAEHDVDMQDVVEDALAEYLEHRGFNVPRRPIDQSHGG